MVYLRSNFFFPVKSLAEEETLINFPLLKSKISEREKNRLKKTNEKPNGKSSTSRRAPAAQKISQTNSTPYHSTAAKWAVKKRKQAKNQPAKKKDKHRLQADAPEFPSPLIAPFPPFLLIAIQPTRKKKDFAVQT
jgi:hypothetical protein